MAIVPEMVVATAMGMAMIATVNIKVMAHMEDTAHMAEVKMRERKKRMCMDV